jgi:penicillin amidase
VWLIRHQPDGYFEGGWPRAIEGALASAIRELESKVGRDTAHWGWGHVRPIQLQHLFSRVNPLLDSVFGVGPIPFGGDSSTIAQGTVDLLNPRGNPLGTANLRAVMDLSDWRRSRFSLLGGQSGNPLSENYEDQIEAFRGVGFELAWTDRDIADRARHSLRLAPV